MADAATTTLTNRQYEQALAILERERPSPAQEQRFRLLNQAVWGALLFSFVYGVMFPVAGAQRAYPALLLAAFCYVLTVPLFFLNLGLVRKLQRAATLRKSLRLAEWLQPFFSRRRHSHPVYNAITLALSAIGYPVCVVGVVGLVLSLLDPSSDGLALSTILIVFGLTCIFIHFIARGAERLKVIAELRSGLLAAAPSSSGDNQESVHVRVEDYDEIAGIEREQIRSDRTRSVARGHRAASTGYVLRLSRQLRDMESELGEDARRLVDERVQQLLAEPEPADARAEYGTGLFRIDVPGTRFEIAYLVDHERREIRACSLAPAIPRGAANRGVN